LIRLALRKRAARNFVADRPLKIALIIIIFVLVTLGPLLALWLRAAFGKPPASRPIPPESGADDDD
jgi:hypothetical protein